MNSQLVNNSFNEWVILLLKRRNKQNRFILFAQTSLEDVLATCKHTHTMLQNVHFQVVDEIQPTVLKKLGKLWPNVQIFTLTIITRQNCINNDMTQWFNFPEKIEPFFKYCENLGKIKIVVKLRSKLAHCFGSIKSLAGFSGWNFN